MKYIDAEKLIAEIDRQEIGCNTDGKHTAEYNTCRKILDIITSLQQEQPFPCWIHANYSSEPEIRHTPSGTPYLQNGPYMIWLSDLETLPKDGTDITNLVPEQPEVNLEKEIATYFHNWTDDVEENVNPNGIEISNGKYAHLSDIEQVARHFYELGLDARKEE